MSASTNAAPAQVITLSDGSIRVGDVVHRPWPLLTVLPQRSRALHQEIIHAYPGSPYFEFANRIPHYIRNVVRALPNYQWSLLELAAAEPKRGYRLLRDYPALAVLIVRRYTPMPHGDRTEYLRSKLALPWEELLREMSLPTRPRTLRILGKLPPEHCFTPVVDQLQCVLRTPGHPWLHVVPHLPKISRDSVALLATDPKYLNPHLLRASVESDFDSTPVYSTLLSVRQLLAEVRRNEEWLYRGVTYEMLRQAEGRLHDKVYVDLTLPFPEPPIPGQPGCIEPIREYAALVDEGEEQHHCASTLVGEIVRGELYAYRILRPTRATLVLQRGEDWLLHDLRGANNAEVPAATHDAIRAWMNAHASQT
jgi:hypothetical protein